MANPEATPDPSSDQEISAAHKLAQELTTIKQESIAQPPAVQPGETHMAAAVRHTDLAEGYGVTTELHAQQGDRQQANDAAFEQSYHQAEAGDALARAEAAGEPLSVGLSEAPVATPAVPEAATADNVIPFPQRQEGEPTTDTEIERAV